MPVASVVSDYLHALARNDLTRAGSLLAENFTFTGPGMDRAVDRQAFLSDFGAKFQAVRDLRVLRQIEAAGDVCTLYVFEVETPAAMASLLMTEWNTVRDSKIESSLLVFDTAPGAPLHGQGPTA